MLLGWYGMMNNFKEFYSGKNILLTGHTGFKGSWMTTMLNMLGANCTGYGLNPEFEYSLFNNANLSRFIKDNRGDILDFAKLKNVLDESNPEMVFHFAAQPLVIESYLNPEYTWKVNLLGTLNLLEAAKTTASIKCIVIVTTDKVYENKERSEGYIETDSLRGIDPYSASKASVELLAESYTGSMFKTKRNYPNVVTVRAGNVIGGGDWAKNRLLPDYYRSRKNNETFKIRNPKNIRPWQHVMDVCGAYLHIGMSIFDTNTSVFDNYNVANLNDEEISVAKLIELINSNSKVVVELIGNFSNFQETKSLKLNSNKLYSSLGWINKLSIIESIHLVDEFYSYPDSRVEEVLRKQILDYLDRL